MSVKIFAGCCSTRESLAGEWQLYPRLSLSSSRSFSLSLSGSLWNSAHINFNYFLRIFDASFAFHTAPRAAATTRRLWPRATATVAACLVGLAVFPPGWVSLQRSPRRFSLYLSLSLNLSLSLSLSLVCLAVKHKHLSQTIKHLATISNVFEVAADTEIKAKRKRKGKTKNEGKNKKKNCFTFVADFCRNLSENERERDKDAAAIFNCANCTMSSFPLPLPITYIPIDLTKYYLATLLAALCAET